MTISPFARWLISTYDWRTAMLTIGIVAWVLLIPAALLVRRRAGLPRPPACRGGSRAGRGDGRHVRRRGAALAAVRGAGAHLLRSAARRIPGRSSTW